MSGSQRRPDLLLLCVLLAVDGVFVALHGLVGLEILSDRAFTLTRDRGYAEIFQYGKELTLALVLASLAWRRGSALYGVWAVIFAYVLVDDSMALHERLGAAIATSQGWPPLLGLRPVDLGEIVVLAGFGGALLLGLAAAYRRAQPESRSFSRILLACLAGLVFFAVAVDLAHQWAFEVRWLRITLDVLEETGEHLVLSLAVWLTLRAATRGRVEAARDPTREPGARHP